MTIFEQKTSMYVFLFVYLSKFGAATIPPTLIPLHTHIHTYATSCSNSLRSNHFLVSSAQRFLHIPTIQVKCHMRSAVVVCIYLATISRTYVFDSLCQSINFSYAMHIWHYEIGRAGNQQTLASPTHPVDGVPSYKFFSVFANFDGEVVKNSCC